jgi:hypothetical protein
MKSPSKKNKKKKGDGNNICQLGIASLIREKTGYGLFRDNLNDIIHSKDKGGILEFNKNTDAFFTKNNINASEYCTDGADVCQRGLGVWFRRGNRRDSDCYNDLSQHAVHAYTDTYDPEIDTLLEKCSRKSVKELDQMCEVHGTDKFRLWNIYMVEKEEELRNQKQKRLKKQLKELKRLGITLEDLELMYAERSSTRSRTRQNKDISPSLVSGW